MPDNFEPRDDLSHCDSCFHNRYNVDRCVKCKHYMGQKPIKYKFSMTDNFEPKVLTDSKYKVLTK